MGSVVDTITDLIDDILDLVVDIVNGIVDLVVDIIETVINTLASLLGFDNDSQTIEQFEVHNQALFDNPDKSTSSETLLNAVIHNEDITAALLFDASFRNGKQNLKKFVKYIDDDNYFEDFPTVESTIMVVNYDDVTDVLNTLNSTPCTINSAKLDSLFIPFWIRYWLQTNKEYDSTTGTFIHNNIKYNINLNSYVYNSTNDNYTLLVTNPVSVNGSQTNTNFAVTIADSYAFTETFQYELTGVGRIEGETTIVAIPAEALTYFTVPTKPIGIHYIITFYKDNDPNNILLWIYKVGAGTYTDLDDPSAEFSGGTEVAKILPAIPIRTNNTNFDATTTTKSTQIQELCDYIGLNASDMIDAVMADVASANISNYNDKVDHVFINFGVRIWDSTQIGMNYLFRLFQNLHVNQAITEAIYNATPSSDDKPYNQILVTATDYKYMFKYSYVTFTHYTKAQVDADSSSEINAVYYSNMSNFDSNNTLIKTYYSSSGKGTYNVGYKADSVSEVNSYVAGNGIAASGTPSTEAASWLQVTQRLTYGSTLYDTNGARSDSIMKPDGAYYMNGSQLTLVAAANEETTNGQEFKFYQIVLNGLNVYTIHAPIALLRVVDAQTSKFKMVKFNIANQNDLMVPFAYNIIKTLPNAHVSQLFLDSAHISLYVAHYEIVEIPWWINLLKIVQVVLIIIAVMTFNPNAMSLEVMIGELVKKIIMQIMIRKIVMVIAKEISPELAIIVAIVLTAQSMSGELDLSSFSDLAELFGQSADLISNIATTYIEDELGEIERDKTTALAMYNAGIDDLAQIRKDLRLDYKGDAINLTQESTRGTIQPKSPAEYLAFYENFNIIGFAEYDYDSKINDVFEVPQYV